ncbi:MAG: sigma-70 family RNA polymerase sigma factor [Planctomycetes bacterium]|nr:sigma-70 family RNA polymerase sigma factor [Planctomycetota bacterium]
MTPGEQPGDELGDLVARAGTGDAPSLDALLVRYLPRLRAFVRLRVNDMVRQRESCSDLVQSVCREVLEGQDGFRWQGEGPFRAWLFRTALNKICERARSMTQQKRDVRREVSPGSQADYGGLRTREPSASQVAMAAELQERMERAFDVLADDHREVIALSRIVGLSHAEIAQALGRSEGAVRMLLSRALVAYVEAMERIVDGRRQDPPA